MTIPPPEERPRRSWPLVSLAATSFVPVLGFVLGAAAVTWGLLSKRPRARLAVILGAAGAFLQLLLIGMFTYRMRDTPVMRQVQAEGAVRDLNAIVLALEDYRSTHGEFLRGLVDLIGRPIPTRLLNVSDESAGMFAQRRLYEYRVSADGRSFDLLAVGPDGAPDTADDIRPTLPDSALRRAGYRP